MVVACSSAQQERVTEWGDSGGEHRSNWQPERERESLSLLKREREREEYHVACPHISLCSCVKQSEQWRGASTSESRGNSGTRVPLGWEIDALTPSHTEGVSRPQDIRALPERERESSQRDGESEESKRGEDYPGPIWKLSACHSEQGWVYLCLCGVAVHVLQVHCACDKCVCVCVSPISSPMHRVSAVLFLLPPSILAKCITCQSMWLTVF